MMEDGVFRINKDKERAKDLFIMANERLNDIIKVLPRNKPYKIMEEYYEIILELLTAIMYADGFKTLSHISSIEYCIKNYKCLTENESKIIDTLRKFRHGIVYYGRKVSGDYLINNEEFIKNIINKLSKLVNSKVK